MIRDYHKCFFRMLFLKGSCSGRLEALWALGSRNLKEPESRKLPYGISL